MPSPKRIRLRDLRKSPGFVTHEQLASVIDAVVLIDEQTGGGGGGSSWFDGAGTPSSGLGVNGDYYLNTTNGDVYEKAGGTWTLVGNIKGPAGTNGTNGVGVPVAGTAGQILAKIDATNYNTEWIDNFTSQVKHEVKAGVALTKGQAVYVSGSTGGSGTNMIVLKSDNTTESQSSKTMGLIAQDLAVNGFGYVITEGLLAGLDTSAAGAAGDPVWLGTNGNLLYGIANKPSAPAHMVFIGIVTRKQSVNGEIFVNVQNGFELQELHNVAITSVANAQLLMYESATFLWKNKTLAQIITEALGNGTPGQLLQTDGSGVFSWQNIPDASDVMKGLVSISNQTFAGIKSFSNGTSAGEIRLFEPSGSGVHWVALKSQAMAADYSITLPAAAPTGAQYLQSTGVGGVLQWTSGTTTGVSSIGTINSATKNPNGAVISGSNIIMQTADATNVGLVSIGTQIFAGAKTFNLPGSSGSAITLSGVGDAVNAQLTFSSATSWINFNANAGNNPTFTNRSTGTRIVLFPYVSPNSLDWAIGWTTGPGSLWLSSPAFIDFYANSGGGVTTPISAGRFQYDGIVRGLNLTASTDANFTIPQLVISGGSCQFISFPNSSGAGAPRFTTRSAGTRIVLYPYVSASSLDWAIGWTSGPGALWLSSPSHIEFYANSGGGVTTPISSGRFQYDLNVRGLNLNASTDATASIPQLLISGAIASWMSFGTVGGGNPTLTDRSVGTRIVLRPFVGASTLDWAIGFTPGPGALWFTSPAGIQFYTNSSITARATIDSSGLTLVAASAYRIGTSQVVGARINGWGAPTATQLRSALTNSSTATDVLQTLSALIVDLRTHGLINN